jgi:hypothetical protein
MSEIAILQQLADAQSATRLSISSLVRGRPNAQEVIDSERQQRPLQGDGRAKYHEREASSGVIKIAHAQEMDNENSK